MYTKSCHSGHVCVLILPIFITSSTVYVEIFDRRKILSISPSCVVCEKFFSEFFSAMYLLIHLTTSWRIPHAVGEIKNLAKYLLQFN